MVVDVEGWRVWILREAQEKTWRGGKRGDEGFRREKERKTGGQNARAIELGTSREEATSTVG